MARSRKPAHETAANEARRYGARYEDETELRSAVESKAGRLPDEIWSSIAPAHESPYDAGELEDSLESLYRSDWWEQESHDRVRAVFNALGGEFTVIDARYARLAAQQLGSYLASADWRSATARASRPVSDRQLMAVGRIALLAAFAASELAPREDARNQFFSNSILAPDAKETGGLREFLEGISTNMAGTLGRVVEESRRNASSVVRQMAAIDLGVQRIIRRRRLDQILDEHAATKDQKGISLDELHERLNEPATWAEQAAVASKLRSETRSRYYAETPSQGMYPLRRRYYRDVKSLVDTLRSRRRKGGDVLSELRALGSVAVRTADGRQRYEPDEAYALVFGPPDISPHHLQPH